MSSSVARLLLRLLLVAFGAAIAGGAAHGHAQLLASEPLDGAVLAARPDAVRLRFNEPVAITRLGLVTPVGTVVDLTGKSEGNTVSVTLPDTLGTGTHVVSYRFVSADGHPIGGTVSFSIGAPTTRPDVAEPARGLLPPAIVAVRAVLLVTLALAVGGALFLVLLPAGYAGRSARRPVFVAASALPLLALVALALQGADALGTGLAAAASLPALAAGFGTSFGTTAILLAGAGLAAAASVAATDRSPARFLAAAAGLATVGAFAASGHAATAPPWPAMAGAVGLHAVAAMFWLGSLVPLARLVADPDRAPSIPVRRFSAAAVPAVALLVATGTALVVVQVETPQALLATDYGRLLLAKLALVAGLLALAAWNRLVLTPRLAAGSAAARGELRRTIGLEIVLGVALLAIVSGWRLTPPPRALHAADRAGISVHIHTAAAMTDLTIRPGQPGANAISLSLTTGDFGPLAAKEVVVQMRPVSGAIEPVERQASRGADGVWHVADIPVPLAGPWSVRVEILVTDFEKTVLEGVVEVGR